MEKSKLLSADLLDIIFEGRNKNYGAYDLRKTYRKRIRIAIFGMLSVCLLLVAATLIANSNGKTKRVVEVADVELENLTEEKQPEPPPVIPPKVEIPKLASIQYTIPKIVQDNEVKDDNEIKEVEKMEDTKIGTITQDGAKDEGFIAPPVEKSTSVVAAPKVTEDYDAIFAVVQIPAEFPGGIGAWTRYLERYLNRDLPIDNGAPPGKYTVVVSFVVSKTGDISDVQALNDPGYGTKAEAIRVIQKGPKWKPAVQNGRNVMYRHKQSITFVVSEE